MRVLLALLACAALIVFASLHALRPVREAAAAGASLGHPTAECAGAAATATFSWTPVSGAIEQWLDVSLLDNNFVPGTFGATWLDAGASSHTLQVAGPHFANFWRVNTLTSTGWVTSPTAAFTPCSSPNLLPGQAFCYTYDYASVEFRWAPLANWQGEQWLEISYDGSFIDAGAARVGPLAPSAQTYRRGGFTSLQTVYWRVLRTIGDAQQVSQVWSFAPDCTPASFNSALYPSDDRLSLPRLGINAPVNVRDVGPDGFLGVPQGAYDVVRYDFGLYPELSGLPGSGGTTLIGGHVDYYYVGPAVFWPLRQVQVGEIVEYVLGNGARLGYRVDWVADVPWDQDLKAYLSQSGGDSLILVTCIGTFDQSVRRYDLRRLVHASRAY